LTERSTIKNERKLKNKRRMMFCEQEIPLLCVRNKLEDLKADEGVKVGIILERNRETGIIIKKRGRHEKSSSVHLIM